MRTDREKQEAMNRIVDTVRQNAEVYKRVFAGPDGEYVLRDLAKRAFAHTTTYDPITHKMGVNEGRRSLYEHIYGLVNKETETLVAEIKGETI